LIHKKILIGGDNRRLIFKPSLTSTTKLFPFLLQHSETEMKKKKTIFVFCSRRKTRPRYFRSSRDIFENIADMSEIARYFRLPKISRYFLGDISARQKYRDISDIRQYIADIINSGLTSST